MLQVLDAPNVIESPAHAKLKAGLLYLSGLDPDHAGERNDVGFDGKDTDFGHSLAAQCNGGRMLSPKQQFYALKMLKKYVGQLERAGLTLPAADELPKFDSPRPPSPPTAHGSANQVRPMVYESNAKPMPTAQRNNGSITLQDKTLVVRLFPIGSFHPERVDALKATLGSHLCRFHPVDKTWHVALEALDKLTALFPDFELDEQARQAKTLAAEMAERRAENKLASVATEADLIIPGFGVTPYPFQKAGIAYALKNKRTFITDSPGLGKTIQALGVTELAQAYPTLVVCPAAVKINWKREAERCLKNKFVFIVDARTTIIPQNMDIVIINYDILGRKQALLTAYPFKMIVFDESHFLKSPKALRSIASKAIAKDREYCLMMSGTPLLNRPQELLNQLEIMGQLKALGGWWHLATTYCGYQQGRGFGAPTRLGELNALLREHCYVRRLKEDVLKELPPKQRTIVPMELDNRAEYEALVDEPVSGEPGAHLARIEELKQLTVKGKLNSVKQWVHEFLETGEKLVLFAWHRDVATMLATTFAEELHYPVPLVIGGIDKETVQRGIDAFQNREECRLIVLNIASGGVGLTLTASSNVAFVELGWNPGAQDQAEDRCVVGGQLIHTRRGFLPIEEIKSGDEVLTHEGRWKRVSATSKRTAISEIITEIQYVGYPSLQTTADHKIWILRGGVRQWTEAANVRPKDFVVLPRGINHSEKQSILRLPASMKTGKTLRFTVRPYGNTKADLRDVVAENPRTIHIPNEVIVDSDLLYLLGWYAAEGYARLRGKDGGLIGMCSHTKERPILERIGNTLEQKFGVNWRIYSSKHTQALDLRVYNGELARLFSALFGRGARNKSLSPFLMDLPPEQAEVFLRAYLDGDGYCRNKQQEWVSASPHLASQIALLVARVGYAPTLRVVRHGHWVGGFTHKGTPSQIDLSKIDENYIYRPVRRVSTSVKKRIKVFDLTVEDDASFVVGMATVHNCHRISQVDSVNAWYLLAENSIDEIIYDIIAAKRIVVDEASNGVIDDDRTKYAMAREIFDQLKRRRARR